MDMRPSELSGERPEISACLLCYNDAETIEAMVERAGLALDDLGAKGEIVVVDDGSSDSSGECLRELAEQEPRLRVVTHPTNRGYGGALRSVLSSANGEWVFYTDGDGQYDPYELVLLSRARKRDTDVVQGYKRGRADSLLRRVVGWAWMVGVRVGFRPGIRDPDCDFRLMRGSSLDSVELRVNSGAITVELVRRLRTAGANFVELEVGHFERRSGSSQFFKPRRVMHTLWDVFSLWITLVVFPALKPSASRREPRPKGRRGPSGAQ
jgi:glycosyltransferase involved in cell wall biosynthesis